MPKLTKKVSFRVDAELGDMLDYLCQEWGVRHAEALRRCIRNQCRVEELSETARRVNRTTRGIVNPGGKVG